MWLLMNVGKRPFFLVPDGKVSLRFEPHLPEFLFTHKETVRVFVEKDGAERAVKIPKDSLAFMFLGKTLVVYRARKKDPVIVLPQAGAKASKTAKATKNPSATK